MSPPRVKVYGIISLTKRQYLVSLLLGVVLLGFLVHMWFNGWDRRVPAAYRPYVVGAIIVGIVVEAIEVFFVMRRFRRLEVEQQSRHSSAIVNK